MGEVADSDLDPTDHDSELETFQKLGIVSLWTVIKTLEAHMESADGCDYVPGQPCSYVSMALGQARQCVLAALLPHHEWPLTKNGWED